MRRWPSSPMGRSLPSPPTPSRITFPLLARALALLTCGCSVRATRSRPSICLAMASHCWWVQKGGAWKQAGDRITSDLGVDLNSVIIGDGGLQEPVAQWRLAYGIDERGAVLVRPDGYVAWRAQSLNL